LGSFFQVEQLGSFHKAVQRRLIRLAIEEIRGDLRGIDLQHIEAILSLCDTTEAHDRVIVPGVDALRSYGTLLLTGPGRLNEGKRHYKVEVCLGMAAELPFGLGQIRLDSATWGLQNCAKVEIDQSPSTEIAYLNSDALRGPVYVRNWEPGDRLRRPGHSGFEKLKLLFQEHRILLWERRHWPVVACGDEVIWTRRFGGSADFLAEPGSQRVVRLLYSV
jgi:tRNA(Ile)-lysidine synthase